MMSAGKDRKRFTHEEKTFLKILINKYKSYVESKLTDGISLQKKKKAWVEITSLFNREPDHTERTVKQLQKCWDNMKSKRKLQLAKQRQAITGTGGSPLKKIYDDTDIDSVVKNATEIEVGDTLDSDTIMMIPTNTEDGSDFTTVVASSIPKYSISDEVVIEPTVTVEIKDVGCMSTSPSRTFAKPSSPCSSRSILPISSTSNNHTVKRIEETKAQKLKKRCVVTARQTEIKTKLEEKIKKLTSQSENEKELHELKKQEALIKVDIQKQILRNACIETEILELKKKCEEEISNIRLNFEKARFEKELNKL